MSERKARGPVGDGTEPWHGTEGGYTNHRCGCPRCRGVYNEAQAERAAAAGDRPIPEHVDPDSYHAYRYYGSKTPGALAANAARRAAQKARQRASTT